MMLQDRPPPTTPRRAVTYRLPVPILAALNQLSKANRRPATTELLIALENHLQLAGRWPPAGREAAAGDAPPPDATTP